MTNLITLTIPNDDHVALRAFGKALEEMALAHGASPTQLQVVNEITMTGEQTEVLCERLKEVLGEPEVDTTAQQVESLAPFKVGDVTLAVDEESGDLEPVADSTGTPWDERIHSASKALNADGTWRLRRKPKDMDEAEWAALVESVKAELLYREQAKAETEQSFVDETPLEAYETDDFVKPPVELHIDPAHDAADTTAELAIEPPVIPPGDDFHTDAGVVTEQTVAGIPSIPVPPPVVVPPVPVSDEQWDFPKLMKFLTERHGKIDVPTVNTLLAVDGLAALTDLNAHPDKIGPFVARVKAHLGE